MKWVKRIGIGIGVLLVLLVGFVVVFFYVLHPKSRAAPNVHAPTTPEVIARGEYLVRHVTGCALCHSPLDETLAIIAYLRTVKPQSKKLPRTTVAFPISMFIRLAPAPLTSSPPAWPTDPTARGKILLEVMSCIDCHSPMVKGKLIDGKHFA